MCRCMMQLLIHKQLFLRKCEVSLSPLESIFFLGFLSGKGFKCGVICIDSSLISIQNAPSAIPTVKPLIICLLLVPSLKVFGAAPTWIPCLPLRILTFSLGWALSLLVQLQMAPTFSPKLFFYVGKSGKLEITLFKDVIPHPVRILNVAGQLNFDGSVRNNLAASGFVICDSDGHVLLTGAKNIGDNTISVAECMALRDGLAYAIHRGWRNILVEGDPKLIIDRVKQEADPPWSICTLIQDIKLLSSFCVALSFNHIYREANFTADSVANLGHVLNPSKLWESGTPVHNSKGSRTHR
ncbi:unnamed protein product [Prunus armeniaca]